MKHLIILLVCFTSVAQDNLWETHKKESRDMMLDHHKQSEILKRFYEGDFEDVKNTTDLNKISLDPDKAKVNNYEVKLGSRDRVNQEAKKYLGVPYVWGSENPTEGFDCSGLVRWVIKKTHGKTIPRTTMDQYRAWSRSIERSLSGVEPGDFVYFKTNGTNPVSHVGIYLGSNKFIHAPNRNDKVKISEIDKYWGDRLVGHVKLETIINQK